MPSVCLPVPVPVPVPVHRRWPLRLLAAIGGAAATACSLAAPVPGELQALVSTGQYVTALDRLDAESALAPRDARLIAQRAMLLSLQKRDAQALRLLEALAARQPELAAAHHLTALILATGGDLEGARAAALRALRSDRNHLPALKTLGELQARQSRQAFEQALKLDSGNAALRGRIEALSAVIGPERLGPAASPFAEPGALDALAPPPGPALPVAVAGDGAQTPPPQRRVVALPDGVAGVDLSAATRHGEAAGDFSFDGVAAGALASTRFFGVPALDIGVGPEPVVTMAPTPAPRAAVAPPNRAQADVNMALREWAAAWSRRDVAGYLAAYAPEFAGGARSREVWERDRRERITAPAHISVELSEVVITVEGDRAEARFRQRYASDKVSAVNRKVLQWQRTPGGAWRISKEAVEG